MFSEMSFNSKLEWWGRWRRWRCWWGRVSFQLYFHVALSVSHRVHSAPVDRSKPFFTFVPCKWYPLLSILPIRWDPFSRSTFHLNSSSFTLQIPPSKSIYLYLLGLIYRWSYHLRSISLSVSTFFPPPPKKMQKQYTWPLSCTEASLYWVDLQNLLFFFLFFVQRKRKTD